MSALISFITLSASQFGFFLLGNRVLDDYILTKDTLENPDPLIKTVYFITVCSSLTLLELLGFEILDLFPRSLRWFFWKLCLTVLLLLLIVILPFLQFKNILFNRSKSQFPKVLVIFFVFYLWCFYKIGLVFPLIDPAIPTLLISIQQGIGRVGIIGITLLALISGYGSVSGPATYIMVRKVTSEQMESTERNYRNAERLLEGKRDQFQRFCERKIAEKPDSSTIGWFLKRVSTAINMNPDDQDSLAEEISNLELIVNNLQSEYETVSYDHQLHLHSKTINGKLFQVLGHFLSIYCVYRIFSAIINILFNRIGRADPVTVGIGFFVHIFGVEWDVQLWSKEISFIFVGCIIIGSIKNFLSEVLKVFRIVDRQEYSKALVLFSSQLVGLYVTSTILMLRLNLPAANRLLLTDILMAVKFDFFEKWFDAIYVFSAVASAVFVYNSKFNKT